MSAETPSATPAPSSVNTLGIIEKLISSGPIDKKKMEVIGKITFGSIAGKDAVAESDLIPRTIDAFVADPTSLLYFVKCLRACVVNCPLARTRCRVEPLFHTLIQHVASCPNEIITTLCAVCMNDETNCMLLKAALEMHSATLRDYALNNIELGKRVSFLDALMH